MKNVFAPVLIATAIFLAFASPARADSIDPFIGQWVGTGITENGAPAENIGLVDRNLSVIIEARGEGFDLIWSTLRPSSGKQSDKVKLSSVNVSFAESGKPGIYRMVGAKEPVSGAPYIWARLADHVLEVHSVTISDRGVLEYQKFVRTLLSDDEMQLRFTRSLDGSIVRTVLAHLTRQ